MMQSKKMFIKIVNTTTENLCAYFPYLYYMFLSGGIVVT